MNAVSNDTHGKMMFQRQTEHNLKYANITLYVLSVICVISGVFASWMLFGHIGSRAYGVCAGSFIVGSFFLALAYCIKTKTQTASQSPHPPLSPPVYQQTKTFANLRADMTPKEDPFCTGLVNYSFIEAEESRRIAKQKVTSYFSESISMSPLESGAMGIMLGMACGDSIGAQYEVLPFLPEGYQPHEANNRLSLKEGQWTDDTSMGLCLADTLIQNKGLDGIQLMWAFLDWWEHGYNNTFTQGEVRNSVGLGGNIELALNEFSKGIAKEDNAFARQASGPYATQAGDIFTNGNGSLMRLGPVAIAAKTEKEALALAWEQSKVTHQGDEAAGCCQLMASLLFQALHSNETDVEKRKEMFFKKISQFQCEVPSVNALAKGAQGVKNPQTDKDENWNWHDQDFSFNSLRIHGCAGSYAMDGLAMALHCIWTTATFEEAVIKSATRGGDADTVGAIVGQLAGAIYGVENIPKEWISNVHQWDRDGEIATRAYLLCHLEDE